MSATRRAAMALVPCAAAAALLAPATGTEGAAARLEAMLRRSLAQYRLNAVLLGALLERATGEPIARLLRRAFLALLRLDGTEYLAGIALRRPVLHAFSRQFDRYEDSTHWDPAWVSHSGLMNTNLRDLGRWARLLGSGAALSDRSYRALTVPINVGRNDSTSDFYYGLGVLVLNRWIVQNGLYFGWNPVMAHLPSRRISLAIFTSIGPESDDGVSHGVRILKEAVRILGPHHPIPDRYN